MFNINQSQNQMIQMNQMKMGQIPNNFPLPNNNMNMNMPPIQMNNPQNNKMPNLGMNMPPIQMNNPQNNQMPNFGMNNMPPIQMNNPQNNQMPNFGMNNMPPIHMNNPQNNQMPNFGMNNIPPIQMNIMQNPQMLNFTMNMQRMQMNNIQNQQMQMNNIQNQQMQMNVNLSNNQSETLSRLRQEFEYCVKDDDLVQIGCSFGLVNDNIHHWIITMTGPKGSPYEGGLFRIKADFPEDYPNHGPELKFINKIYHLNVNFTDDPGHICINSINSWRLTGKVREQPFYTMKQALFDIFSLFYKQGVESAYDQKMAELYQNHRDQFDQEARKWTKLYASMASMMVNNNN